MNTTEQLSQLQTYINDRNWDEAQMLLEELLPYIQEANLSDIDFGLYVDESDVKFTAPDVMAGLEELSSYGVELL